MVSQQRVTARCWVAAALSVCYRKIFCCQQFCKVTLDCHCARGKGHLFICLPPQTVNSFQWCLPSSIINCLWINDSLLFCTRKSGVVVWHWLIHPAAIPPRPLISLRCFSIFSSALGHLDNKVSIADTCHRHNPPQDPLILTGTLL